jgi:hypothetical protein
MLAHRGTVVFEFADLEQFHFRCSGIRSVGNNFGTRIP